MLRTMCLCLGVVFSLHASEPILVGIAGGSGSGKTTVARKITESFGDSVVIISQDSYYKDLLHLPHHERAQANFDHPDSLDFDLLVTHLQQLKAWQSIECPTYDFVNHARRADTITIEPRRVILVEGILLMAVPELRELFDIKLFIETDDDVRLIRRINRDIEERGRTLQNVQAQYLATVRPMYLQFVEPSKRYADLIVPWGWHNDTAIELIVSKLREHNEGVKYANAL